MPVAGAANYLIERGTGESPWQIQFAGAGLTAEPRFTDLAKGERGTIRYYRVIAVDAIAQRGGPSLTVRTQPRAPAMPVVSVLAGGGLEIDWAASPEPDVVGYDLYRFDGWERITYGRKPVGLTKLNDAPLAERRFTLKDAAAATGENAGPLFVVRAVNRAGVESGPSPWADTLITEPTGLLAREVDGKVTLTWTANPQKGVRGYNVYRADSGSGDVKTLAKKIAGPVAGTRFVDESKADRRACKYYVTAIDAAGREGRASYGAWFNDDGRN